jgi:hypothetical protein
VCRYFLGNKCDKNRNKKRKKKEEKEKKVKEKKDEIVLQKCYICPKRWK